MKFIYLLLSAGFIFVSCQSKNADLEQRVEELEDKIANETVKEPDNDNIVSSDTLSIGTFPVISFKQKTHNFGKIKEGDKVRHTFEFTNTGNAPLIIQNASASCGCTVPDWPREPIAPGKSGKIEVEFNSAGKPGTQTKNVAITANTNPAISTINIVAVVESKE